MLVRLLSPEEIGTFKVFFLYLTVLPALALTSGIMSGLGYWAGQGDRRAPAFQVSAFFIFCAAVALSVAIFLLRPLLGGALGWGPTEVLLFSVAAFGTIASPFFDEAAIATGRIWTGSLFFAISEILRTLALVVVAFITHDLTAVLLAHTVLTVAKALVGLSYGMRLGIVSLSPPRQEMAAVARYALPVSVAWLFGIVVNYADQLILSAYISAADFAFYSIGCLVIPPLLIIEQSVTRVLIPQLSEAFSQKRPAHAAMLFQEAIEHLALLLVPSVVGLIVFAEPIISLLFTEKYLSASPYLIIYALGYLILMFPYDSVQRARGEAQWILRNFIVFSLVSLGLALLGATSLGPMGALLAMLTSKTLMRSWSVLYVQRTTGWKFSEFIPWGILLRVTLLSLLLGGCAHLTRGLFSSPLTWLFVSGSLFWVAYLPVSSFLRNRHRHRTHPSRRVLIVTQTLDIGGLERMVLHLVKHVKAHHQWEPRLFVYDQIQDVGRATLIPEFEQAGVPVEHFKKRPGFSVEVLWRLFRHVMRHDVQLVHCQDLGGLMYAVIVKLLSCGRFRLIQTQHSFVHLRKARRYVWYEKFFSLFIDKLTVVSDDTKQTYVEFGFDGTSIDIVENGVDFPTAALTPEARRQARANVIASLDQPLQDRLKSCLDKTWMVYLARLHSQKGQRRALELWRHLPPTVRKDSLLILVGPEAERGEREHLQGEIARIPDGGSILLPGPSRDPRRWIEASDLFLSCSEFEGMPLAPLEAAGAGVPVVLSDIPGHVFLAGLSEQFPLHDAAASARAIERVYTRLQADRAVYTKDLWLHSQQLRDRFSLDHMAETYERLYRSVLGVP